MVKKSKPNCRAELHEDWASFLNFVTPVLTLHLSYSDSEGFGSITLNPEFFRKLLLSDAKYQTRFLGEKSFVFKDPGIKLKDIYSEGDVEINPTPDLMHKKNLHFWKNSFGKQALSDQGFLYVWNQTDLESIENQISDEYGDRGGPYHELRLSFKEGSVITLETQSEISLQVIKEFLT